MKTARPYCKVAADVSALRIDKRMRFSLCVPGACVLPYTVNE
jgi:hypothetical protein